MSLGFQPGVFEDGRQKFWGGLHAQDSEGIFQHRGPVFRMDFQLEKKNSLFDVERVYFCGVWNDKWFDVPRDALLRSQAFLQMHIGG